MEKKLVRVPFDLEMAKRITSGEVEGRIVTRRGDNARIIHFDAKNKCCIIALIDYGDGDEIPESYTQRGFYTADENQEFECDLVIEVPEYHAFKEGDILFSVYGPFIYNGKYNDKHGYGAYCSINSMGILNITGDGYIKEGNSNWTTKEVRYATEAERQELFQALQKCTEYKAKEYLRFFPISKPALGKEI